jgi:glycosyltransferase involved in cell wall biosynthesis
MRILQCAGDIDPAMGGSVEAARQLSIALDKAGHSVELVTLREPRPEWIEQWRGSVHYLGPSSTRYLYSRSLPGWIAERANHLDAVVVHGLWRYTGVGVWRGLRGRSVPYFVFPHGMLDPYFKHAFRWQHVQKSIFWRMAESRVVRDARAVLFTSEEERRRARLTFRPYACRECVVGLGIARPEREKEVEKRAFLTQFPQLTGKRIVLFLGRIHPKKGCDLLIHAFARVASAHPLFHLVIAGPDECGLRAGLERLAMELGVAKRVTWTGPLNGGLKWGALHASEVMALPSHAENFGIAVIEAMACGVPVLLSKEVNIWREIEADGAGFAAQPDIRGVTSLLERWLASTDEQRAGMSDRALQSFSKRFELEHFADEFIACVKKA